MGWGEAEEGRGKGEERDREGRSVASGSSERAIVVHHTAREQIHVRGSKSNN
jgi:hypothetical protein